MFSVLLRNMDWLIDIDIDKTAFFLLIHATFRELCWVVGYSVIIHQLVVDC